MLNWLMKLFKPKNLDKHKNFILNNKFENKTEESVNVAENINTIKDIELESKVDEYVGVDTLNLDSTNNSKDNNNDTSKNTDTDSEERSDIKKQYIINDNEKESIYQMYEVNATWESKNTCFLSTYDIKGYTKYTSELVAGAHYHKDEILSLLKIIKEEELLFIRAYCEKEPDNPYDKHAAKVMVDVLEEDEVKSFHVGYLPKDVAKCFEHIEDIPLVVWSIEVSDYIDVYIYVYAENDICERAFKEKERLLKLKKIYDDNLDEIENLIKEGDILEEKGLVDEAMEKFKLALDLGNVMPHPVERLMFYYRRKMDYENEMNVISKFQNQNVYRLDWDYYEERYKKAEELNKKKNEPEDKIETKDKNSNFKTCSCCKEEKSIENFNKNGKDAKGNVRYRSKCKECIRLDKYKK